MSGNNYKFFELPDGSLVQVVALVDADGNIFSPSAGSGDGEPIEWTDVLNKPFNIVNISNRQVLTSDVANSRFVNTDFDSLLGSLTEGVVPIKGESGFMDSSITETEDRIIFTKDVETPPGSLLIGEVVRLSAANRAVNLTNEATGQRALVLSGLYDNSGSSQPFHYKFNELTTFDLQVNDDVSSGGNDISFSMTVTENILLRGLSFISSSGEGTLRFTIKRGDVNGVILYTGLVDVILNPNTLFLSNPSIFDAGDVLFIEITGAELNGTIIDGNFIPYVVTHRQTFTRVELIDRDNLVSALEGLTDDSRLSYEALKDLPNAEDIAITPGSIIDADGNNIQSGLGSLQRQINTNRNSQGVTRDSFGIFNDGYTIDNLNAAVNGGRVNFYTAKTDKIVTVVLPTTAHLAAAGLTYPYAIEFVHSGGSARFTSTNLLRVDAGSTNEGDRIDTTSDGLDRERFTLLQEDIAIFIKDSAEADYRVEVGAFNAIAEISRRGVFAFRNDINLVDINNIDIQLASIAVNQGDALLINNVGTRFGYNLVPEDIIIALVDNPSLAIDSDDWLVVANDRNITASQALLLNNFVRDGIRFDATRNVFINPSNVIEQMNQANGIVENEEDSFFFSATDTTERTFPIGSKPIQFTDLTGGNLILSGAFTTNFLNGFPPEPLSLKLTYGSNEFIFDTTGLSLDGTQFTIETDIPNSDYSSILNTDVNIELTFNVRGSSFVGGLRIDSLINTLTGPLHSSIESIASLEASKVETNINSQLKAIRGNVDTSEHNLESIIPRVSPTGSKINFTPNADVLFLDTTATGSLPDTLFQFSGVTTENPRFRGLDVSLFIAIPNDSSQISHILTVTNQGTIIQLDNSLVIATTTYLGISYFVYQVLGLTALDTYEVSTSTEIPIIVWQDDIDTIKGNINRLDSELEHAAINLEDSVIDVFDNSVSVIEESNPSIIPSDYNKQLGSSDTQKVFLEPNANTITNASLNSRPINIELVTDSYRNKLVYINSDANYPNQDVIVANDSVTTTTPLVSFRDGNYYGKQFIDAIPAGETTDIVYPSPLNTISGRTFWQTLNTIPVSANELFFVNDVPSVSTPLIINYRGHANGNSFGENTVTLPGNQDSITFVLDDGSETATVEVLRRNGQIRVSVTERVNNGLPTINDVQVILSYVRTIDVSFVPSRVKEILLESASSTDQVFAIRSSIDNTLILIGTNTEFDTNYPYTELFGTNEDGFLTVFGTSPIFFDYQGFEPIETTITDLENHSTLPQRGLFTTVYTHNTVLDIATQLRTRDSNGNNVSVGQSLTLIDRDDNKLYNVFIDKGLLSVEEVV